MERFAGAGFAALTSAVLSLARAAWCSNGATDSASVTGEEALRLW